MGLFDNLKGKAGEARARAGDLTAQHQGKIEKAMDKAASAADRKTGGKYRSQISSASAKAREGLDKIAETDKKDPNGSSGVSGL